MAKSLEGFTLDEQCTIILALKEEMLRYKGLVKQDNYWSYREKIASIYRAFDKMGYDRQAVDRYINM